MVPVICRFTIEKERSGEFNEHIKELSPRSLTCGDNPTEREIMAVRPRVTGDRRCANTMDMSQCADPAVSPAPPAVEVEVVILSSPHAGCVGLLWAGQPHSTAVFTSRSRRKDSNYQSVQDSIHQTTTTTVKVIDDN